MSISDLNINDVKFGMWLNENGWQFYDSAERMVLIDGGGRNIHEVELTVDLFAAYQMENPEP